LGGGQSSPIVLRMIFLKQVKIEGKRYIVYRNEAEAEKDRKDREAIVAALDAQLKKGDGASSATRPVDGIYARSAKPRTNGRSRSTLESSPKRPVSTESSCSGRTRK